MTFKTCKMTYHGNLDWLVDRTILLTLFGSRAYGTDRPDSDWDFRGVCIPPQSYRDGFLLNFAQAQLNADGNAIEVQGFNVKDPDGTIYGILKFFRLAADCNPSIIEALFVDEEALLHTTPQGEAMREVRNQFLSRKACHTFRGYAMQQWRRIETHRKWLMDPPTHRPERSEFDLPEPVEISNEQMRAALSMVQKRLDMWEIDFGDLEEAEKIYIHEQMFTFLVEVLVGADPSAFGAGAELSDTKFTAACRHLGFDENFIDFITREKQWRKGVKQWEQFCEWKKKRNPARAELEKKHGYDTKHGMHLVRLMRMCREILTDGVVLVRRPDAEELNAIRDGRWSYEQLTEWANREDKELIEVARTSPLPKQPDRVALDALCQQLVATMR